MLKRSVFNSETFKKNAKDFVLVDINTDHQPSVAQQFNVSALPTIVFLNSAGNEIHRTVGGRPLDAFLKLLDQVRGMAGK